MGDRSLQQIANCDVRRAACGGYRPSAFSLRLALAVLALLTVSLGARAQDVFGAVLTGSLVKPQVGAWAWYDLSDKVAKTSFIMRLAIVGSEKVGGKDGYWLEIQVVPTLGYEAVYKMLLTGPAKDPANIHKVFLREGLNSAEEVPVSGICSKEEGKAKKEAKGGVTAETKPAEKDEQGDKSLVGTEDVKTLGGVVSAQHYVVKTAGEAVDVWLNDAVAPMGVVQLKSERGTLALRNNGVGGPNADSILDKPSVKREDVGNEMKVDVRVEKK